MCDHIHDRLAGRTVEIGDPLHDVPPHAVYEITVDGRRAVYKESVAPRGSAGVESRVLRFVSAETSVPVPEVLAVGEDWFVTAYREDAPVESDDERRLEPTWLRVAGRTLARLHEEATVERPGLFTVDGDPGDEASALVVDSATDAGWSDALDDQLSVYERVLRGTGYADAIAETRTFLTTHADRFDVLDGGEASLCHGWFTPEHVAIDGDEAACVIDFEHAIAGSPEWDYWRTAIPLFVGPAWDGPADAQERFRETYESVRPLPEGFDDRADAYRAFVAASHLDSLATQRGIDDETREIAAFLTEQIADHLEACRAAWE